MLALNNSGRALKIVRLFCSKFVCCFVCLDRKQQQQNVDCVVLKAYCVIMSLCIQVITYRVINYAYLLLIAFLLFDYCISVNRLSQFFVAQ